MRSPTRRLFRRLRADIPTSVPMPSTDRQAGDGRPTGRPTAAQIMTLTTAVASQFFNGRSVSSLVGRSISRSVDRSVGRSVGRSVSRPVRRSIGRVVGRSVWQLVGRFVRLLFARSVGPSVAQSGGRSIGRPVERLIRLFADGRPCYYIPLAITRQILWRLRRSGLGQSRPLRPSAR